MKRENRFVKSRQRKLTEAKYDGIVKQASDLHNTLKSIYDELESGKISYEDVAGSIHKVYNAVQLINTALETIDENFNNVDA